MKILTIPVLILFISLTANGKPNDPVVKVNGTPITKEVFEQTYQQNQLFVSDRIVSKRKVLDDLINRELGIQKAKKSKLDTDEEVKRKIEDILYHAMISKDLEPELKKITVADKEVEDYYKENKEYRTSHILLRLRINATEEEISAAQDQIFKIKKDIDKNPAKFSELANKYSQSAAAANGGDIGFMPPPRLAPEYYAAIKGKSKDHITEPVRTQYGYHIIKILAIKDFKDINQGLYKKIIYDQKRDKILENYFDKLKTSAKIEILDKTLTN